MKALVRPPFRPFGLGLGFVLALSGSARGQDDHDASVRAQNLPAEIRGRLESSPFGKRYEASFELNPFYLRGDFDGDGQPDVALLIRERTSGKVGIAFFRAAAAAPVVLGAGIEFGNGGDDFAWMEVWSVLPAEGGDAEGLYVEKPEAASAVIAWDGRGFVWRQLGD